MLINTIPFFDCNSQLNYETRHFLPLRLVQSLLILSLARLPAPVQALVLVHRGGGSAVQLMTLAREIQDAVHARFGVRIEPEPVVV